MFKSKANLIKVLFLAAALFACAFFAVISYSGAWFYKHESVTDMGLNAEVFEVDIQDTDVTVVGNYRMKMTTVLNDDPYFNMAVAVTEVTVTNTGTVSIYAGISVYEDDGVTPINQPTTPIKCAVLLTAHSAITNDAYGYKNYQAAILSAVTGGFVYANQNTQLNALNSSMEKKLLTPTAPNNTMSFVMVFWVDHWDSGYESGDALSDNGFKVKVGIIASDTNWPNNQY